MKTLALILSLLTFQCYAQEWESIETPVTDNLILFDISFPGDQSDIGYTGGSNVTYNGQGTLLKSIDAGSNWEVIWSSTTNGTGITAMHFFSTTNGMVGTMDGSIMSTTDGGENWDTVDFAPDVDQGEVTDIEFYDDLNGALISQWEGIYITSDGGATWTQAATNYLGGNSLTYADENNLFACGGEQRIYHSEDGGMNWSQSFQGPNGNMLWPNIGIGFFDSMNGLVTSEEGQIFTTTDGGETWSTGVVENQFGLMRGVAYTSIDEVYIAATPGAVYVSADGGSTWSFDSPVDFDPSYYQIIFTANGTGYVCGSGATGGTILRKISTLGVSNIVKNEITLYPNPAQDIVRISGDFPNSNVKIVDVMGKLVFQSKLNGNKVDVSPLPNGIYTLVVTDSKGQGFSNQLLIER